MPYTRCLICAVYTECPGTGESLKRLNPYRILEYTVRVEDKSRTGRYSH